MDLMLLFAEGMDLNRNLDRYAAKDQSKLDLFIGTTDWRDLLTERRPTIALREFYKERMRKYLGYEAFSSYDRPVRNSKHAELYKLIFASKIQARQRPLGQGQQGRPRRPDQLDRLDG
jgi:hypothetical protein